MEGVDLLRFVEWTILNKQPSFGQGIAEIHVDTISSESKSLGVGQTLVRTGDTITLFISSKSCGVHLTILEPSPFRLSHFPTRQPLKMNSVRVQILFCLALLSILSTANARLGAQKKQVSGKYRRRKLLQHRKLYYAPDDDAIPDQYLVVFKDGDSEEEINAMLNKWLGNALVGAKVVHQYYNAFRAVTISRISINVLRLMLSDSRVLFIEEVS